MATAHQDGSSNGTAHWKKLTVQEMQGAMEAGGLKASLIQRFSNETLQRRSKPSENDPSRQPGLETRGVELGGKIHQTEHKEKSALLNIIGDGKYSVDRLTEPEIQSVAVRALIDPQHGGLSGAVPSSDLGKRQRRAERFGLSVQLSEDEKRRARAARFGGSPADPLEVNSLGEGLRKSEEQKKRKARAERFGLPVNSLLDEEEKRKARLVRFGMGIKYDSLEEEKREARAARFGLLSNNGASEVN